MSVLRQINLPDGKLSIVNENGIILTIREAYRSHIRNRVSHYERIIDGKSAFLPLTVGVAHTILNRIESGENYSSSYLFYDQSSLAKYTHDFTVRHHSLSSTGEKYWFHQEAMENYRTNDPHTVISTHISPEGSCNLKCPFCIVTYRKTHSRLEMDTIKDYVEKLISRGLKAVTLSGGGEPLLYSHINDLIRWLVYDKGLELGLITNGTRFNRLEKDVMKAFTWIRVSVNVFPGWEEKILTPEHISDSCLVGVSFVYTSQHEANSELSNQEEMFQKLSRLSTRLDAKYIRVVPDVMLDENSLIIQHGIIKDILSNLNDPRFLHQHKTHGIPKASVCHRSFFRPCLSEEPWRETGKPGSVYPCASLGMLDESQYLREKYQLCQAKDILEYLDGRLASQVVPSQDCDGCPYVRQVDMLDDWKTGKILLPLLPDRNITHPNFI